MAKKIPSNQFVFSVACLVMSSSLLTKTLYTFCKNESWVGVVLGFLFTLILVLIYGALAKKFSAMTLIEINDAVFGPLLGKVSSGLYIFYFLSIAFLNAVVIGNFISAFVLQNTPKIFVTIILTYICGRAVRKGAVVFTSFSNIIAIVSISAVLINTLLLIKDFEIDNLLPVLSLPANNYLIGSHIVAMIPFGEIFIFYMMMPKLQHPEKFSKMLILGLSIGASFMLIVVLRDILVIGNFTLHSSMPSFEVIRMIDIGDILTRLEVAYAVVLMVLMFFKINVCFYATAEGIRRLMKLDSYDFLIHILSVLIVIYAVSALPTVAEESLWLSTGVAEMYEMFFLLILPSLTLLVAAIRDLKFNRTQRSTQ